MSFCGLPKIHEKWTCQLESSNESKICTLALQINHQVTIFCPRTDYRYKWAETICITKNGENIWMIEVGTYPKFMLDPL